jgi:hypothetical protein
MVHHSLEQCRIAGLSTDWQLNIAYNGVLQAANAALLAAGYRGGLRCGTIRQNMVLGKRRNR